MKNKYHTIDSFEIKEMENGTFELLIKGEWNGEFKNRMQISHFLYHHFVLFDALTADEIAKITGISKEERYHDEIMSIDLDDEWCTLTPENKRKVKEYQEKHR